MKIVQVGEHVASFVSVRGSVPLVWERTGDKVRLTRGRESQELAFARHFTYMQVQNGKKEKRKNEKKRVF